MTRSPMIVVGVDGSPASVDALRWAVRQAQLTGSTLNTMISWQYPTQYGNEFYIESISWPDLAEKALSNAIAAAAGAGSISCTRSVTEGHPAYELVKASVDADLVVMGSRGHGGFAGMLLGSVSEYVIAHADCPVVVIRHHGEAPPPTTAQETS